MSASSFEFATAGRVIFGIGTSAQVAPLAASLGSSVLLVTGRNAARAQPLLDSLREAGLRVSLVSLAGEPTLAEVQQGAEQARAMRCEVVIGFGGGAAMDAAKAIAALATNPGDPLDYLEVIGKAQPLERAPLPCIAIPTTAGSGAEVTRNAVLTSPEHRVKVSLRHALMLPRIAIVDPALCVTLPPSLTAASGMDALTQLIEAFVSTRANPLTDALCREAIPRAARALRRAVSHPDDLEARSDMSLASLFSGMALANAGLGAVHGFAAPIGGTFDAPHGAVCARLLPFVFEENARLIQARMPASPILARFTEIAQMLTGRAQASVEEGIAWLHALVRDLPIPPLSAYGMRVEDVPMLAERAAQANSMRSNPIALAQEDRVRMLMRAL
ncbi:MAG: iron-containing alcohol dehydrogenase [Thermoflexales bacterium]|nr:iron-containing alcohol dehydrogenase [Thermoflexales bacterium]MCS7324029.1 iron-containing alcohol dehydrogenase [Thermoflexales bacterium]MDW8053513.1 iron-containing alcohol dehydrogenase [Anaerolineae bacterium]MDW8292191.1 iron-containing alcohol dehydrogenase [Anaerolineae bacterium]